jgi:hypothetical protein
MKTLLALIVNFAILLGLAYFFPEAFNVLLTVVVFLMVATAVVALTSILKGN